MDTLTTTHPVCRLARPEDDLSALMKHDGHTVNREQVWVAVSERGVEGVVMMWDAGHSVVYADHFLLRPDAPSSTGPQLVLAINQYCQDHGKTILTWISDSLELAYQAKRRGALVNGPSYRVRYRITNQEGARHG